MKVLAILTLLFGLFLLAPAAALPGIGPGPVSAQVIDADDTVDDVTGEVDDAAGDADEATEEVEDAADDLVDDAADALANDDDTAVVPGDDTDYTGAIDDTVAGTVEDLADEAQGGGEIFVPAAPETVTSQAAAGATSPQVTMPPVQAPSSQASGVTIIPPTTGDAGLSAASTEGTSTAAGIVAIALFGLAIALTARIAR